VLSSLKRCPAAGAAIVEYACIIKYAWQVRVSFAQSFLIAGSNDSPSNECEAFEQNCVGGKNSFSGSSERWLCNNRICAPGDCILSCDCRWDGVT